MQPSSQTRYPYFNILLPVVNLLFIFNILSNSFNREVNDTSTHEAAEVGEDILLYLFIVLGLCIKNMHKIRSVLS